MDKGIEKIKSLEDEIIKLEISKKEIETEMSEQKLSISDLNCFDNDEDNLKNCKVFLLVSQCKKRFCDLRRSTKSNMFLCFLLNFVILGIMGTIIYLFSFFQANSIFAIALADIVASSITTGLYYVDTEYAKLNKIIKHEELDEENLLSILKEYFPDILEKSKTYDKLISLNSKKISIEEEIKKKITLKEKLESARNSIISEYIEKNKEFSDLIDAKFKEIEKESEQVVEAEKPKQIIKKKDSNTDYNN